MQVFRLVATNKQPHPGGGHLYTVYAEFDMAIGTSLCSTSVDAFEAIVKMLTPNQIGVLNGKRYDHSDSTGASLRTYYAADDNSRFVDPWNAGGVVETEVSARDESDWWKPEGWTLDEEA